MKKYKLNELAKDLGVSGKKIASIIEEKFGVEKKSQTSLEQNEINIVFELLTMENSVENFDAYFNSKKEKPKKAEPKVEKKQEPKAEAKPVKKAEPKPEVKPEPKEEKKAEPKQEPKAQQEPKVKSVQNTKPSAPKKQVHQPQAQKQKGERVDAATFFKGTSSESTEKPQVQTNIHHVDTRTVHVDLDKYNEKYNTLASNSEAGRRDNYSKKQKINQKSRDKRPSPKKETEAQKLQRLALERARKQQLKVLIPDEIVVSELASRLKVTATAVIGKLMPLGVMAGINEVIDFDTASLVAEELGAKVEKEEVITIEERLLGSVEEEDAEENLVERSPIVVVMGHVDHGKTSILDHIRNASVTSTEAGGITQHIGAYKVKSGDKEITFLDTPGHEAFTSMRARGASVTDIAILVVAADDGVMPQTVEAINHAKAAGVGIIVAINKIDKPAANIEKVKQELIEYELVPEEWGGDTIICPVSAHTGEGMDNLLEMVLLVAEVKELKANPNRAAKGTVVEARLDKGRGPVTTLLVQNGTLKQGDVIIAGTAVGRVRAMISDTGKTIQKAGPSTPVEITGLAEVPQAGDDFNAVADERLARELVEKRRHEMKEAQFKQYQKVTLENLFTHIAEGEIKELPIIVKADVQGSAEAVKQSLEKLSTDEVKVKIIHSGVGGITKSDIMLANASNAIVIGFNVRPDSNARDEAEAENVEMRLYRIIYDAIEDVKDAMKGMLDPKIREVQLGRAEVREVYKISNVGTVAGSYVIEGKVARSALIRVVRDNVVIAEDKIDSLKRFKDDAKEVAQGYECGIGLEKFNDIKVGDIFESFILEEYRD
ncbi:MAG: translation initiation factor IF-2 [Oscillospiraceae bacterium]|nr:translation initiation factor IF-2 [Oscillospiraceae bacterium]